MLNRVKGNRYFFITDVLFCFFLCAFVCPVPVYAVGEIAAWGAGQAGQLGDHDRGQCIVPEPNTGFTAIAAGGVFSLGLKRDGSIAAWGYNGDGECNVPSPNAGFLAISAGWYHSLGLKADGSIVAWGGNDYGECTVPQPNTGFMAIAAGAAYSLGLKQDGSIVAWGANYLGQCNVPSPNTGFTAIAAGEHHSLGLKGCQYNLSGDLNNDCKVDFLDFATMADNWLIDCFNEPNNPACVHK